MLENIYTPGEKNLVLGAVWGLVLMVWVIAVIFWVMRRDMKARQLRRRIGLVEEKKDTPSKVLSLWRDEGDQATTTVPHTTLLMRVRQRLERIPLEAGWDVSVYLVLAAAFVSVGFLFVGTWVLVGSTLPATGVAIMAVLAMVFYVRRKSGKRHEIFERQFEDAMNLVSRSLRAGQPLLGSFQLVAAEMDEPISRVFHDICQQQALGLSLEEAIRRVAGSYANKDLNLFATSVVIQLRTGGNLADMMNRLAAILRDRLKLIRRVRVLTAQTEYSKRVLLVLPLVMFVVLTGMNPDYMDPMIETTEGRYLSILAGSMMLTGTFVMNRMIKVEY